MSTKDKIEKENEIIPFAEDILIPFAEDILIPFAEDIPELEFYDYEI